MSSFRPNSKKDYYLAYFLSFCRRICDRGHSFWFKTPNFFTYRPK